MKLIITGGYGLIGSNLIKKLNKKYQIINFENIEKKKYLNNKYINKGIKTYNYSKINLINKIKDNKIKCLIHLGAISDTKFGDKRKLKKLNYDFSKKILDICFKKKINLIYASSAAVYGNTKNFSEGFQIYRKKFDPTNYYAKTKIDFDIYVKKFISSKNKIAIPNIVGLRLFNVYGINEFHKEGQSSPIFLFYKQFLTKNRITYFYNKRLNSRDFIFVDDVIKIICSLMNYKKIHDIINIGTGKSTSFRRVAFQCAKYLGCEVKKEKFSAKLLKGYQFYTKSNNKNFKRYFKNFKYVNLKTGVKHYLKKLKSIKNLKKYLNNDQSFF